MPELPEIHNLAKQMARKLKGLTIESVELKQPKCLNVPPKRFEKLVVGKTIGLVTSRGKWVFCALEPGGRLLLNLGMGGDCLYHKPGAKPPDKYQARFVFTDGSSLSLRFWWFGYIHAVAEGELAEHPMTATLGVDPLSKEEFSLERFLGMLEGRRGAIKQYLLDQKHIAGVGNVYAQDILFMARIHPKRTIPSLSDAERRALHGAIVEHLSAATKKGGLKYEKDLFGKEGGFSEFQVAYREGEACPVCGATIEKIKTGSTASYVCPKCQV